MRYQRFIDTLGLAAPQGVAISGQTLAVVDTGNHRAVLASTADLSLPSTAIATLGTTPNSSEMLFPTAAMFRTPQELVIVDTQNNRLAHFGIDGATPEFLGATNPFDGLPPQGDIVDIALDDHGVLLLLDRTNRRIIRLDTVSRSVALHLADPEWEQPSAIAWARDYLWVADEGRHRLYRYDQALQRFSFSNFGDAPGQIRSPNGLLFDPVNKVLYVAEAGASRLSVFEKTGAFVSTCSVPTGNHRLGKIALDGSSTLYLVDEAANGLHVIDLASDPSEPSGPFPAQLNFEHVVVGAIRILPFLLRNPSDRDVTFTEVSVLGEGFSIDPSEVVTPIVVPAGGHVSLALHFAPLVRGLRVGDLSTVSDDALAPLGNVRVMGTGVDVPTCSLALVLDTSGSMAQSSGVMPKIERLKSACEVLFDILSLRAGDDLAIVEFSSDARSAQLLSPVDPALLESVSSTVSAFTTGGQTGIGAGLERAYSELANSEQNVRNVILLTDGKENLPPAIADVATPANVRTFAIGLGLPENIDVDKLSALASASGGYFQITDGDDSLLSKFFLQVLTDINGDQVLLDPTFKPASGKTYEFPFQVSEFERELRALITFDHRDSEFELEWVLPKGNVLTIETGTVRRGRRHLLTSLPVRGTRWEEPGKWLLRVKCLRASKAEVAVLVITTASDLGVEYKITLTPATASNGKHPRTANAERAHRSRPHGLALYQGAVAEASQNDTLHIEVKAPEAAGRAQFATGAVTLWQPYLSLSEKRALNDPADHDKMKGVGRRIESESKRKPIMKKFSQKKTGQSDSGTLELLINGHDGMHRLEIKISFVSALGYLVQRERTFHLLVQRSRIQDEAKRGGRVDNKPAKTILDDRYRVNTGL